MGHESKTAEISRDAWELAKTHEDIAQEICAAFMQGIAVFDATRQAEVQDISLEKSFTGAPPNERTK